jgi:hypothetical protein
MGLAALQALPKRDKNAPELAAIGEKMCLENEKAQMERQVKD